ncbi:glycosyltransferase family 4 protein [Streptomyces sp. RB6PN25]|uniref:Glycosyltransferase family 4 protein n=1 Tax=Streptomyces humicola TaxID=2953240 RepID=A0ABT1PT06_9ACTN|nr:glycosyltransferase family 4 protein [Streptomyces humicola]MCQ4079687.1 glycosyltransferase family 4 protein [Streptomyces humicola]
MKATGSHPHLVPPPRRLHVALVHSFYRSASPSGENQAVVDQAKALRQTGHRVSIVAAHTDELQATPFYAARAGLTVATGRGRSPLAELKRLRPDVVHVHNLFPNLGTGWLKHWRGPLVATLHNYRPACAAGTLFRDGKICTACPDGDQWAGVRYGCYRGMRSATLPLAWAGRAGTAAHPLLRRADRLVTLSERSRDLYLRFGLPAGKLVVVPNSVDVPRDLSVESAPALSGTGARWLFVGRLTEEKGIVQLLRSWPQGESLDVVGSGPLESACRAVAPIGVRMLGALRREQVLAVLARYTGLVFPSICFEGAPLVCQEALAAGVPVLALAGTGAADSVARDGTGAVYHNADDLPRILTAAGRTFPGLREHCRRVHAERYSVRSWTQAMVTVYSQAIGHAAGPREAVAAGAPTC